MSEEPTEEKISPEEVSEWVNSTHNCAIMYDGTIHFRRRSGRGWIVQRLPDLYTAIRQCIHIHAKLAGQVIDFHRRHPEFFASGEIDLTRSTLDRLQEIVTLITRTENPDPADYFNVVKGLEHLSLRFGRVRDPDKIIMAKALEQREALYDDSGALNADAAEALSRGIVSAVRRYGSLRSMISATETDIQLLSRKGRVYDERLRVAYRNAGESVVFVAGLIRTIEEKQRRNESIAAEAGQLLIHNRRHVMARVINALAILNANPYYMLVQESEIRALRNIGGVIELWDAGRGAHAHLYRIQTILHNARSRMERLIAESLSVQYEQRIRGMQIGE